jgi:hypothetical protein
MRWVVFVSAPSLLVTIAVSDTSASAQGCPASGAPGRVGDICRGVASVNGARHDFFYVWVRLNADDTADSWTLSGPLIPAASVPVNPPPSASHIGPASVSHFDNGIVGFSYQPPLGWPTTMMVSLSTRKMNRFHGLIPIECASK